MGLTHGDNSRGNSILTLMALTIVLAFGSGPAWANRVDTCLAVLEGNAEQLRRSEARIKAIYERQEHTSEEIRLAGDRLLESGGADTAKRDFVRDILQGYDDANQAFYDLGDAWLDREVLLRSLGKMAVECVTSR